MVLFFRKKENLHYFPSWFIIRKVSSWGIMRRVVTYIHLRTERLHDISVKVRPNGLERCENCIAVCQLLS